MNRLPSLLILPIALTASTNGFRSRDRNQSSSATHRLGTQALHPDKERPQHPPTFRGGGDPQPKPFPLPDTLTRLQEDRASGFEEHLLR